MGPADALLAHLPSREADVVDAAVMRTPLTPHALHEHPAAWLAVEAAAESVAPELVQLAHWHEVLVLDPQLQELARRCWELIWAAMPAVAWAATGRMLVGMAKPSDRPAARRSV